MFKKILIGISVIIVSVGMAFANVNINTASQSELESLPGVGAAKAKAVIDYRKNNGNFKTIDDIKKVKGFGDKNFDQIKSQLTVGEVKKPSAPAKTGKKAAK